MAQNLANLVPFLFKNLDLHYLYVIDLKLNKLNYLGLNLSIVLMDQTKK